jgi:two-component system sensor histidine kinase ChvG
VKETANSDQDADVILGDEWVVPKPQDNKNAEPPKKTRGLKVLRTSPLARKIVTFNLIALAVLVAGVLYTNAAQESLTRQRAIAIDNEAQLIASVIQIELAQIQAPPANQLESFNAQTALAKLPLSAGSEVFLYNTDLDLLARSTGASVQVSKSTAIAQTETYFTDALSALWKIISAPFAQTDAPTSSAKEHVTTIARQAMKAQDTVSARIGVASDSVIAAAAPIFDNDQIVAIVTLTSAVGEIDRLTRIERERVLQMFFIAICVSIGLSLVLASTIANPLADLSAAAELGRDRNSQNVRPGQVRIPDMTARPDEIGRLSGALRSMVAALYTRIEGNEQFAADVAHEIKNPLASLRSAVGTLRMVKREEQRDRLLDVIDHDVRRLDRLVSDISNASRLDAELVKEQEEEFNILKMLDNLGKYLGEQARDNDIDFFVDFPSEPVIVNGLEARLAQVFVNLITNAISFCDEGDAIRVWARKRENRILIVVEDTGPGIPDQALSKIFKRFYSERPKEHFGNNSGLGLAISKQIVEAHGGVIWAENIRPTEADITSEPLGARFIVGLPI